MSCNTAPTWHLYGFLENAPFLFPEWFVVNLNSPALCGSALRALVLSGCVVALRLDHTQPTVLQSLLRKEHKKNCSNTTA